MKLLEDEFKEQRLELKGKKNEIIHNATPIHGDFLAMLARFIELNFEDKKVKMKKKSLFYNQGFS